MRIVLAGLVSGISMLVAGGAMAEDDLFANYYENTIVITNADGATSVFISPDGTFHETLPDGTALSGTWTLKDATSCFMIEGFEPHCTPASARNVGDEWEVPAIDGTMEKAVLKAGR